MIKTIVMMMALATIAVLAVAAATPMLLDNAQQQEAFAKEKHGNSFKQCHSFGPGHSDDACFK